MDKDKIKKNKDDKDWPEEFSRKEIRARNAENEKDRDRKEKHGKNTGNCVNNWVFVLIEWISDHF